MRLRYRAEARRDVSEAYHWYETQSPGLGGGLRVALRRVEELIKEYPEAFPVVYADVRRALLRRYPYAVYYRRCDEMTWEILACLHMRRGRRQTGDG